MSAERDRFYLEYMERRLAAIERSGVAQWGPEGLAADPDATLYRLQTLCESSKRLSDGLKADHPEVEWRAMAGFRNTLVHEFQHVDADVVDSVVRNDLPILGRAVGSELSLSLARERDRTEDLGLGL